MNLFKNTSPEHATYLLKVNVNNSFNTLFKIL